jgi:hypothetical protein
MGFFDWFTVIGAGREASKSIRKPTIKVRCRRCRRKTIHKRATDNEELEFRTDYYQHKKVVRKAITYTAQKLGIGEVFNHVDNYYT